MNRYLYFFLAHSLLTLSLVSLPAHAKHVLYELTANHGSVNLSGKKSVDWALNINGTIPAPTLEFTEGDDAEIVVHNRLKEEVSIHWHGILLPPDMDGVAYVNTLPILPGASHKFRFKLRQHGTYWYHSHTMLQEQKGVYGAIIIHPKDKKIEYDRDVVAVISDWSDENPDEIIKNLRKDGDYYLYKKNSVRSISGAYQADALGTYFQNEWDRMGGMDLSDVGYDAFLINGKRNTSLYVGKPGERVRLRIINAAASTYFHVALGKEPMQVISADGMDIKPALAKEILIGMAETYDLLVSIPEGEQVELRATAQDGTGLASGWIGSGDKVFAPKKPIPDPYASMDHGAHAGHGMDHSAAEHAVMGHGAFPTLTVDSIQAPNSTAFAPSKPVLDLKLVLGGDMERYVWHINGQAIHEDRNINIRAGERIRFTFVNETMMHHPMHLHGHFFRVLNQFGEKSPLKHTVDVPPHGTRVIEFFSDEPGEWMLHCHNLYHMKTGMARVVKYMSFTPKPEIAVHQSYDPHNHDHLYHSGKVALFSNHLMANFKLSGTWTDYELNSEFNELQESPVYRMTGIYRRWFNNFFAAAAGIRRDSELSRENSMVLGGVQYILPMLIESRLFVDHVGRGSLDLEKRLQWTSIFYSDLEFKFGYTKPDLSATLIYGPSWSWGVGVRASTHGLGIGGQVRF